MDRGHTIAIVAAILKAGDDVKDAAFKLTSIYFMPAEQPTPLEYARRARAIVDAAEETAGGERASTSDIAAAYDYLRQSPGGLE